jgi:hypothetical protein
MTSKEITETIELLHQFFKVDCACHVSTFVAHREAKDGSMKKVTFTISDHGERPAPAKRYSAEATWDGGKAGYEGDTIKEALAMQFPWDQQPAPVVVLNPIVNFINPANPQKPAQ